MKENYIDNLWVDRVMNACRDCELSIKKHYYVEEDLPPKKLYHYTSLSTLASMLDHGYLSPNSFMFGRWLAGSCLTQNDSQEFGIAGKAFHDCIANSSDKHVKNIAKMTSSKAQILGWHFLETALKTHAICFSEARDDLQQWLIYGDGGRGVCLEIDSEILLSCAKAKGLNFANTLYGEDSISKFLPQIFDECNHLFKKEIIENGKTIKEPMLPLAFFISFIHFIGGRSKSMHFSNEKEWRLFTTFGIGREENKRINTQYKVWNKDGFLKQGVFADLEPTASLVSEIVLGPLCDHRNTSQTLDSLRFQFTKCRNLKISNSTVPYVG